MTRPSEFLRRLAHFPSGKIFLLLDQKKEIIYLFLFISFFGFVVLVPVCLRFFPNFSARSDLNSVSKNIQNRVHRLSSLGQVQN